MKNADMPASPLVLEVMVNEHGTKTVNDCYEGITKREYAAIKAMQGISANQFNCSMKPEAAAKESVAMADALLKELEK